ncbi:MAG: NapC/NirT family cytochrome c [Candidatus Krumholzibacteriia bacterium]
MQMQQDGERRGGLTARWRNWFTNRLHVFWDNWLSASGSMLSLVSVFLLALMFLLYVYNAVAGHESNPYVDLVGFMVLPAFLVLGVILIIAGNALRRAREKREGRRHFPFDISGDTLVRRALVLSVGVFVVLIGVGLFSYEAYHYTDSNQFCSTVCHEVMAPEAAAHARSPHANVNCVDCHIGPGASWFVRAKLSGMRQVYAVLTDDFHRPIPTPVENLRPARETCEVCHWPTRFHGSTLVAHPRFASDRDNTARTTALVLHVGGPVAPHKGGAPTGIHWHVAAGNQVRYRHLDRQRQQIAEVVLTTPDGESRYTMGAADQDTGAGEWRTMDCLDCHNRPTHIYELPNRAARRGHARRRRRRARALDPARGRARPAGGQAQRRHRRRPRPRPDGHLSPGASGRPRRPRGEAGSDRGGAGGHPRAQRLAADEHRVGHLRQQPVAFRWDGRDRRGGLLPLPQRRVRERRRPDDRAGLRHLPRAAGRGGAGLEGRGRPDRGRLPPLTAPGALSGGRCTRRRPSRTAAARPPIRAA